VKIGIIGLGFVGLSLASVLGSKKYNVVGIDSDRKKVSTILSGKSPFYEPKLDIMLKKALAKSLQISSDIQFATSNCQLLFITVGTPPSKDGYIDLTKVKQVAKEIGEALSKTVNKPIIIVKSTVAPGTTNEVIKFILEKYSKKKAGVGFGIIANPEFLREGKAVDDTISPHIVVIGGNDQKSISRVKKFFLKMHGNKVPLIETNHQTAELIKYANNSFLATKISFINQIASICQSLPETNVEDVVRAIGLDPRIGKLFLKAGPGYGGSCLPKDLQTLIKFSSRIGKKPILLEAVRETNNFQVRNLMILIKEALQKIRGRRISILGLSFKEGSDDIRESVSIKLIRLLLKKQAKIIVHDPKAIENTKMIFGDKISYADSVKAAIKGSHCTVIMTPWKEYSNLTNNDLRLMKRRLIIDSRRLLDRYKLDAEYHAIGIGE